MALQKAKIQTASELEATPMELLKRITGFSDDSVIILKNKCSALISHWFLAEDKMNSDDQVRRRDSQREGWHRTEVRG